MQELELLENCIAAIRRMQSGEAMSLADRALLMKVVVDLEELHAALQRIDGSDKRRAVITEVVARVAEILLRIVFDRM